MLTQTFCISLFVCTLLLHKHSISFFTGFVDMCVEHIPSPVASAGVKVANTYTGPLDSPLAQDMLSCSMDAKHVMVHTTKLYPDQEAITFHVFGRVLCGTLHAGQVVRVLGENYSLTDEEDSRQATIGRLWVSVARYVLSIQSFYTNAFHASIIIEVSCAQIETLGG